MSPLKLLRYSAWGSVAGIVLVLGLLSVGAISFDVPSKSVGRPELGGEFSLVDQRGEPRSWASFRGKAAAVFFGFTNCPDICPATLWELSERLRELGTEGDKLSVILISVDPARDTPEVLNRYLQSFDKRIVALTGGDQEVEKAVKSFKAYSQKVPIEGGYTMDHTALVLLFDPNGKFVTTLDRHEASNIQMQKLRRTLKN